MSTRINQIADAVASYLIANQSSLPTIVAGINAAPVTYYAADVSCGPRIWVHPISTATSPDTRNSWRIDYQIGVTVTSLLATADDDELKVMQEVAERVRNIIRDVPASGAEFLEVGEESAIPEFSVEDEATGQFFHSTLLVNYFDVEE